MLTKQRLAPMLALMLAGCGSIGGGKYLVAGIKGKPPYMQVDTYSPEACAAEWRAMETNPGMDVSCTTTSQESALKYSFVVTNIISNQPVTFRMITLRACESLRSEMLKKKDAKDSQVKAFDISECK